MEVKVQLKHIIIISIIVIYTFGAILLDLKNQIYNPTLNIAFIYDSMDLGVENDANQVWEALNEIQSSFDFEKIDTRYDSIELQNVNLTGSMNDHIGEYAAKNEVVTIFGDSYNDEMEDVILRNPQTDFIMIDSGYEKEYNNLTKIEIDNTTKVEKISQEIIDNTKTNKVLFVASAEDAEIQYQDFLNQVSADPSIRVEPLVFSDTSDNVSIKKELLAKFNEGYDTVYVATRELNKIVIETASEVQSDIITNISEVNAQNEELISQNSETSADTSESDEESAEETIDKEEYQYDQKLINVYVSGDENLSSGIYYTDDTKTTTDNVVRKYIDLNIEEQLTELIEDVLVGQIEHKTIYLDFDNQGLEFIEE